MSEPRSDPPAPYPAHREADVVLRDGSTIHVRPIRPDDESRLLTFFAGLSRESRALRFFSAAVDLEAAARREARVDYVKTFGLVATVGVEERVVGDAIYGQVADDAAEVAFAIADDHQGRGIATILLGQLAEAAAEHGIREFVAEVLPENHRMIDVFRASGFRVQVTSGLDSLHVRFPTSLTEEAIEHFERREQIAATSALASFLGPRSVAVIGASRRRGTVGGELFHNLLEYQFAGPVYPVNPAAAVVQSVTAYPTVGAIPGPVDLAVAAIPAERVVQAAAQCGRKGVRALVVLSAGFAESGEPGRARQAELLAVCRSFGMRLVGPNCIGILNTDPAVRLHATFGRTVPPPGRVAFASQSGALGLAAIDHAARLGFGISSFVSTGNKADLSGNDLLNYWETDPRTDLILLYLESFGNPRKFGRIARRVGRTKPIVVVKSGRSAAGARATSSHTAALLAASDVTVDALFRQAGVIRTDTLAELFDVASLLARQAPPEGRRVGIVSNVHGPAVLCADTCVAEGLELPDLAEETRARLRGRLAPHASVDNPVDMLPSATAGQYHDAIGLVAADSNVDAVIVIFMPPLATSPDDVAAAIVAAGDDAAGRKPILAVFMASGGIPAALRRPDARIPTYGSPEAAAIALARAARHGAWRAQPPIHPAPPEDVRRDEAAAIVARALGAGVGRLDPADVAALLSCYGLPTSDQAVAATPADGVEMIVGVVHDQHFGPVVACGAGGAMAELLGDVAVRLSPLTRVDAAEMLRELKTYPLLTGFRGGPTRDVAALEEILLRVSALAEDIPQVAELDCNPVVVHEQGAHIAGARVRVEPAEPPRPLGARR